MCTYFTSQLEYFPRAVISCIALYYFTLYFTLLLFLFCFDVALCFHAPLELNMYWQTSNTIPHNSWKNKWSYYIQYSEINSQMTFRYFINKFEG